MEQVLWGYKTKGFFAGSDWVGLLVHFPFEMSKLGFDQYDQTDTDTDIPFPDQNDTDTNITCLFGFMQGQGVSLTC